MCFSWNRCIEIVKRCIPLIHRLNYAHVTCVWVLWYPETKKCVTKKNIWSRVCVSFNILYLVFSNRFYFAILRPIHPNILKCFQFLISPVYILDIIRFKSNKSSTSISSSGSRGFGLDLGTDLSYNKTKWNIKKNWRRCDNLIQGKKLYLAIPNWGNFGFDYSWFDVNLKLSPSKCIYINVNN